MEACFATELHRVLGSWTAEVLLCLLGYMTRMKAAFGVTFQEVGVSLWGEADSRISSMSTELLVNADSNLVVVARLQPTSLQTVSAIASMYDDTFPEALQGMVSKKEFKYCIDLINQTLDDYFPCIPCFACGYLCCISTFGLSLLMPEPCTRELKTNLDIVLRRINNREEFLYRGLIWKHQRCQHNHSSCIEICQILYE